MKEHRSDNTVLPKWRVKCSYETLVQSSALGFLFSLSAKNPPLRQYPNRYMKWRLE